MAPVNERLSDVDPIFSLRRMVTDGLLITVIDPTSYLLRRRACNFARSVRPLAFHRRLLLTIDFMTPLFSPLYVHRLFTNGYIEIYLPNSTNF